MESPDSTLQDGQQQRPPPSLPETVPVTLNGFAKREDAEKLAEAVVAAMRALSSVMDLGRVDGVTIAYDYEAALANLNRGFATSRPLQRSHDERIIGVAMAPLVLRDGVVKTHLVFFAPVVEPLSNPNDPHWQQAFGLVAHECAHAMMQKRRDEVCPGVLLQQAIDDPEIALLDSVAWAIINEWSACRIAGCFADPDAVSGYEDVLVKALAVVDETRCKALKAYRLHGDINRVLAEAGNALCEPLRLAAYLYGHVQSQGKTLAEAAPQATAALAASSLRPFIEQAMQHAEEAFLALLNGTSPATAPLYNILRRLFAWGGLHLRRLPDGTLWVDVPFTPETMP